MASLTVRNIPEDVKRLFHQRAAANGRSMEEEGRRLIIEAVRAKPQPPRKSIGQMLYEGSRPGVDLPELPDSPASFASFDDE
jgi:antitoxin FitA